MMFRKALALFVLIGLSVFAFGSSAHAVTSSVSVSANVTFAVPVTISLSETAISYGTLNSQPTNINVLGTPVNVSYTTNRPAWTIRVYVDNKPGETGEDDKPGLYDSENDKFILQKIWCANFGAPGPEGYTNPNNPDGSVNEAVWSGAGDPDAANWFLWAEKDAMDPGNPFTWRRLAYSGAELPSGFATYVAGDFRSASIGNYSASLVYEIINE